MAQRDAQKMHGVLILGPTPKFVDQLMVRPDFAGMVDQYLQKVILGRRQPHRRFAHGHLSPAQIDSEIIHRENVSLCRAYAAQGRAHARQQLRHGKRLGKIVMSALIEGTDFLGFFVTDRDDDNGRDRPLPQIPYDLLAIRAGRAEMEKNQIRPHRQNIPQRFFSVADSINRISCHRQRGAEGLAHRLLVVNKKDSWADRPRLQRCLFYPLNCDIRHCRTFWESLPPFLFRVDASLFFSFLVGPCR